MLIEADEHDLKNSGQKFLNYVEEFETIIKDIGKEVESTKQYWEGVDINGFVQKMNDYHFVQLGKLEEDLKNYAEFLITAGKMYGALDETFESKTLDV